MASIFVAELRAAGRLVKLVGLGGKRFAGVHGLTLVPDMTLGQALPHASNAVYVIIPFAGAGLQRFASDPRLQQLCEQARDNGACFIHCDDQAATASLHALLAVDRPHKVSSEISHAGPEEMVAYPHGAALYEFVAQLAQPVPV